MSRQLRSPVVTRPRFPGWTRPTGVVVGMMITLGLTGAACTGAPVAPAPSPSASSPVGPASGAGPVTDYSQPGSWLALPTTRPLPIDVFYLYPTAYQKAGPDASDTAAVTDAGMRAGAQAAYARQASLFEAVANVVAPYYRQLDATYALRLPPDAHVAAIAGAPTIDATAAFAWYLEHVNGGRPFILAGHSQGSDVLCHLLAGYLREHPDAYARMVAAYAVGYSVTPAFLAANAHLRFAERADDTGVIVSYNTEAPTIGGVNPVMLAGALAINPITWTRAERPAAASASLGSWLPDSAGAYRRVDHYADARVDLARGVVVASTPDVSTWAPGKPGGFPAGVYHSLDYSFYYFDLQANAKARIAAYR